MKRSLLFHTFNLYVFLCNVNQLFGQNPLPFPMNNAMWTIDVQTQGFGPPIPPPVGHSIRFYQTTGDTIIAGTSYTKIEEEEGSIHAFIREFDRRIYCRYSENLPFDTSEFLLYDFNLEIGDTFKLRYAGNLFQYHNGYVTDVDSVLIENVYHKRIHISSADYFSFIEGVGAAQGLFYPEIPPVDYWADLVCFSINDTIYSIDGSGTYFLGNCQQKLAVNKFEQTKLTIYPNPFTNTVYISGLEVKKAIVYSLTGEVLKVSNNNSLNLESLREGIYVLEIIDRNDKKETVKIIKH